MSAAMSYTPKQARRRYFKTFFPAMGAYVALIFLAAFLVNSDRVQGAWVIPLAILPGLAVLSFLYAWFRFIRETDELQRRVQTEGAMVGLAVVLSVCMGWGIIELFDETLPKIPIFYVFPLYFASQGLAVWRLSRKYGTGFCLP